MGIDNTEDREHLLGLALRGGNQLPFDWDVCTGTLTLSQAAARGADHLDIARITNSSKIAALISTDDICQCDIQLRDATSGPWIWASLYGEVTHRDATGEAQRMVGVLADISPQRLAQLQSQKIAAMYAALSQANQAIARTEDPVTLFEEICRISVEYGNFAMATIRQVNYETRLLDLMASCGEHIEFFNSAQVSINPELAIGRGPSGRAIRSNQYQLANDLAARDFHAPWKDAAVALGIRAVASFPFEVKGSPGGVLNLYANDRDYFDGDMCRLLVEITQNISYALSNFERIAQRHAMEQALADSEKFKAAILTAALDSIVSFDEQGAIIDFNPAAERTFGHSRAHTLGQDFHKLLLADQPHGPAEQDIAQLLQTGASPLLNRRVERTATHAGGMHFPVELAIVPIFLRDRRVYTAYLRDISVQKQTHAVLQDSEARYRNLIDLSPEAILVHQRGKFVLLNEACVQLFGARNAEELLGRDVLPFMHPDHRERGVERARELPLGVLRNVFVDEVWLRCDGSPFYTEVAASKFMYMGSRAIQLVMRDVTARRMAEDLQHMQTRVLGMIAAGTALKEILTTLCNFIESQSQRARCMMHIVDGSVLQIATAPSLSQASLAPFNDLPVTSGSHQFGSALGTNDLVNCQDIRTDALWRGQRDAAQALGIRAATSWPVRGRNSKALGTLTLLYADNVAPSTREIQLIDIAANLAGVAIENKQAEERIRHLAHYDELTGLPNRTLFNQILTHAMKTSTRAQQKLAVLFVDLDRFKNINDTLGHDAGDLALQEISSRMRGCLRESDTVARMGGDEFYILIEDLLDSEHAARIARKILVEAARPFHIQQQECRLSASIGIAIYPEDGADALTLLKNSDIAMYRAKTGSKDTYQFYSASKNIHSLGRLALESQLRRGIENHEFVLHYQPKVNLANGRITGVEALVRWMHPEQGMLAPNYFIPLAEETSLIVPLGKMILQMACEDAIAINLGCDQPIRVAVNLSARQFDDSEFLSDLQRVLSQTGLEPDLLQLEITESMVMNNPEQAVRTMTELQEMGIRLDIDDFGTGYSSLTYLKRFPVYSLKIDRSFIQDLHNGANDVAITKAIIAMGHSMGLRIVAEGVELIEQMDALRDFGCDEFQGFYFSRPVPLQDFVTLQRGQLALQ
jgi:diguanylate cyclase (GGDEF)-like protein/PAS domain S-box-containing protein